MFIYTQKLALAIALCPLFVYAQSPGQTETVSVDDAVQMGLKRNPQVAAGLTGLAANRATYLALGVPAPFSVGASQVGGTSTAASVNGDTSDTILSVSGTLDTSGQRRYQAASSHASYLANGYQFLETLLSIEHQIRDAYWTLGAANAQLEISEESLKEAQRVYALTVTQEKAGSSPHADVVRSSIDVANAKQAVLIARNGRQTAQITFNTLLSLPPQASIHLSSHLTEDTSPAPTVTLPPLEEIIREASHQRPLVKSAEESSRAANFAVHQAESSRFPDFNAMYQRSVRNQLDAITLTISIPLFDFGGISQSIRGAKDLKKQADFQKVQAEQQVAQQVSQAYADLETAIESAASYKKDILAPSTSLLEMTKLGYQQGALGILPVIDAESTIRTAKIGYISSLLAIYKAQDELLNAIGKVDRLAGVPKALK